MTLLNTKTFSRKHDIVSSNKRSVLKLKSSTWFILMKTDYFVLTLKVHKSIFGFILL